jgi:uncharacterized Fe-S cluster-containing protein
MVNDATIMKEEKSALLRRNLEQLPGLNCGLCGYKTCEDFAAFVTMSGTPEEMKKCVSLTQVATISPKQTASQASDACAGCASVIPPFSGGIPEWKDLLGRDYDFILSTFPNDPGPRETILPHNPSLTRELGIRKDDVVIGRPMGMSCGCPITHCGIVMDVDHRTGIIVWCVTGPLQPRLKGFKDIGYYAAEAYEGIVKDTKKELKVGLRFWFLPRRCMLQWRHSGLVNFIAHTKDGLRVRIEGLMIG